MTAAETSTRRPVTLLGRLGFTPRLPNFRINHPDMPFSPLESAVYHAVGRAGKDCV